MQREGHLDEAVLNRFFYLLTKHGKVPVQVVRRLREARDEDGLHTKGNILDIVRRGTGPDD